MITASKQRPHLYILSYGLAVISLLFIQLSFAETWDFRDKHLSLGSGKEDKTSDEKFRATKIIFDAQYFLKSQQKEIADNLKCCAKPSLPEKLYGLMDAQLRWGTENTGLEYTSIGFTPIAIMWQPDNDSTDKFRTKWDLLELGATRFIADDALELESYLEFSFLRAGRMGAYNWSKDSNFTITTGMQASVGWVWAKSKEPTYSKVSNPFSGIFFDIALEHNSWGKLYTRQRFVNGFSFSSPARGHPTAREARVRLGYFKLIYNCFAVDIYIEKRSIYFTEGDLPDLYNQSGTAAAEITCQWR